MQLLKQSLSFFIAVVFLLFPSVTVLAGESEDSSPEETDNTISSAPELDISEADDPFVMCVSLPGETPFVIDPYEQEGKGQLYSDEFVIENHGSSDVRLIFTSIGVAFHGQGEFVPLAIPFDETVASRAKDIYMTMRFPDRDAAVIVITDVTRSDAPQFILEAAGQERSRLVFQYTGNINHAPELPWKAGDVRVEFQYRLEPVIDLQEAEPPTEDTPEESPEEMETPSELTSSADEAISQNEETENPVAPEVSTESTTESLPAEPDPVGAPAESEEIAQATTEPEKL